MVTSAAGYPLDTTYYQTVKGMVAPLDILAPGGNLIVASECSEGIGSPEYRDAQRRLLARGVDGFFADISRKSHADIDEWQTQMQLKPMRRGAVHLYTTGLRAKIAQLTGVNLIESVSEAVLRCTQTGDSTDIAVIPEGPYVVPVYRPSA